MGNLSISEYGLQFVQECFTRYIGSAFFVVLFVAAVSYFFNAQKASERYLFGYMPLFMFCTIFNPLVPYYVLQKFHFDNEYYRFFWILPMIPAVACACTYFFDDLKRWWKKLLFLAVLLVFLIATATPFLNPESLVNYPQNIYKVPNDLITICDMIHSDSEEEQPTVAFESYLNLLARQYDPSLHLAIDRNSQLYFKGSDLVGESFQTYDYSMKAYLLEVLLNGKEIDFSNFQSALNYTGTNYLVVYRPRNNTKYFTNAGCTQIGSTSSYIVYRY